MIAYFRGNAIDVASAQLRQYCKHLEKKRFLKFHSNI